MKTAKTALTEIILEKRKANKKGLHPVKLRVTYRIIQGKDGTTKRKYYTLTGLDKKSLYMDQAGFDAMNEDKKSKKLKVHLNALEEKAIDIIDDLDKKKIPFSFPVFEEVYFSKPKDDNDLFSILQSMAKEKRDEGKISTAVAYECTIKSLKEHTSRERLSFSNVSVKFLKDYEKWMLEPRIKGNHKISKVNSRTTVGIYLRNVRAAFNKVKPSGILYPFGKGLYSIPKGKNIKKALTQADVSKIANYAAIRGSVEERSRDLWLFSYLCNGINIKDIARLKYSNIKGDHIVLERAKTAESAEDESMIDIIITRQIGRIIDRHGNKPGEQSQYIFPILNNDMTPEDEYKAIQQAVQTINKNMIKVCDAVKIPKVTTYTARHSFATVLKRSGASIEFISESLGHRNKETTQAYLATFEDDEKRKWANMLLPENNE